MVPPAAPNTARNSLRTELDSKVALLPAVLQSEDSVSLVDHLSSIFSEQDWTGLAKCSSFSSTTELSQQPPEGWLHFQQQLQQGANALQAEAGQQAMNTALARVQDNIITIQSTTCLPPMFTGKLSTDKAGSLQIVRCSVCHSLLLAAAFNSHLPSCRPCPIPSGPNKSKTSGLLHAKAASAAHKSASQGKGKKKLQSKGSKKPPAGPSRFAVEQTKQIVQQPGFRPAPSDAFVELLSRSSDAQPDAKLSKSQPMTDSTSEAQAGTDLTLNGMPPARDPGQCDRNASGTRLAWTYGPHMSRKNPELDAVNDPALPPRFPYSVCRTSKRKSRSASQELPHFLLTESESLKVQDDLPPHSKYETSKLPLGDLTDQSAAQQPRLKQNGHAISQRAHATKRQQQHAKQAQHGAVLPADLAQQQSADLHLLGVHHQSQQVHARGQNGAALMSPSMAHQAGNQSVHQARAGLQGTQFTAQQGQQMYSPSHVMQQIPTCQGVMGQASQQQAHEPHVAHQGQGASTANGYAIMAQQQQQQQLQHQQLQHQQQQYQSVMPLDGYSYFAQQSIPWQNAAAAAPYQTNGYSPTAFHGGPFRLPVSKQKVSMNALAHMPYHT